MDRNVSSFGLAGCLSFERPGAILEGNSKIFRAVSPLCCVAGWTKAMFRQGCGRQESRDVLEPRPRRAQVL